MPKNNSATALMPTQIRQKYLDFMANQGHAIVPSSPLVPDNDPTTLFTGSGMQPMVPYLLGQPHPKGTRIVDSQKCFRAQDIEEVGDNRHTTFFEMLGNWSLGDYFKKEQLRWFWTFLTDSNQGVGLDPKRLFVTVFRGSQALSIPRDSESVGIWKELFAQAGIEAQDIDFAEKDGLQDGRIFYYDESKNWWSRAGAPVNMPLGEPGGPDSEVFYDFGAELQLHQQSDFKAQPCHVNCDCGRFLEIGNSVFMEYQKVADGEGFAFKELPQKNVDFGGGLERIAAAVAHDRDVFKTGLFSPIMDLLSDLSGQSYDQTDDLTRHSFRVIADHLKAATMLAADGVFPSNKEQGYFARRLVRRAIRYARMIGITGSFVAQVGQVVAQLYQDQYPAVTAQLKNVVAQLSSEEDKFNRTLEKGEREIEKYLHQKTHQSLSTSGVKKTSPPVITPTQAFTLYETYGFPLELTLEIVTEQKIGLLPSNQTDFTKEFNQAKVLHADASRTASAGKFKGGLQDHSDMVIKFHTATHLLHAALRQIVGDHVQQKGSNITGERLRFDFSHSAALTTQEKQQVESQVNDWIAQDLPVTKQVMNKQAALKSGAIAFFIEKYPDEVSVYTVGQDPTNNWISKEFCGGPHVEHTGQIGPLKLTKEQAVSAGVRRVYMEVA